MSGTGNIDNLTPWEPGESGNPNGRPKGRRNLATIIRDVLEDENFDWSVIPRHGKNLQERFGGLGSPWNVFVYLAMLQTMIGDKDARLWLTLAGYGNKIDVTSGGKEIQQPLVVSVIQARNVQPGPQTTDGS